MRESARPYTIVYDGECPLCRSSVERVARRDRNAQFDMVPRQASDLLERFPQLAESQSADGMRLTENYGERRVWIGPDAVFQIGRRVTPHKYLAWIYRVPILKQCCQVGYWILAKNRQRVGRWVCKDNACSREPTR